MELELAITSYQRLSPTVISSKQFSTSQRYILGRAKDCDWCLPDPDRVISSRHAEIFSRDGVFLLKDISTNGVFVNGASDAIGASAEVTLNDGDRLRFGDYEFGVRLSPAELEALAGERLLAPVVPLPRPAPGKALDELPVHETMGGNPTLASGLQEQRLGDSHVEIPDAAIPPVWSWGAPTESQPDKSHATDSASAGEDRLAALFDGLGMPQLTQSASPALLRDFGNLTRILLERLLDLLHARAEQKQKLRVQQTLFQRNENNPLKFSATAQDAIEALLVRRHSSFLGPQEAVEEAFADVIQHERALMTGVEQVIAQLLQPSGETASYSRLPVLRKARAYDAWLDQRERQRNEFADNDRMLRSDVFVEAYERAIDPSDKE